MEDIKLGELDIGKCILYNEKTGEILLETEPLNEEKLKKFRIGTITNDNY